jgi:hypothetical protein
MGNTSKTEPFAIGDGASYGIGSDRYAGTIVAASPTGHRVIFQYDDAKWDFSKEEYTYTRNLLAGTMVFTRRKDGGYRPLFSNCGGLGRGRHQYRDPSF